MPKTAVVILNYNGQKYLAQFLPSLIQHTTEAEIIVADNQSTDGSIAFLKEVGGIRIIELEENFGYAGGYNEALRQIDADYYVLVNSDIEVTPGWLKPMTDYLDTNPSCIAAQPKIKSFYNRSHFEYAGAAGGFLDQLAYPYCRGRIFNTLEEDVGQYDEHKELFWASGACFIIRSKDFHALEGFDNDFFAHMEEIDLCWRIHSNRGKIMYVPDTVVYHVGGGTLHKSNPRKTYLNFRNGISLLVKNMPLTRLILVFPLRLVLDVLAGLKFSIDNRDIRHLFYVLKAHIDSLRRLRRNLNKRDSTSVPTGRHFIAWDYFIRKKKLYSDL